MSQLGKPLKAILIGLGVMGQNHLRALRQSGDYEILGVADEDADKAELVGDAPFATDHRALPLDNADVIIVATPTVTHYELIVSLAALSAHVFVEKPIFDRVCWVKNMQHLIAPERLSVGYIERFNPAIIKLRQVIASGQLGDIIHCAFTRVGGFPRNVNHSRNVIIDLAVHDIDLFYWFFGEAEVIGAAKHRLEDGTIHTSDILLRSGSGTTASIHSNWITPTKIRTLWVTGTHGVCFVDMLEQSCELHTNGLFVNVDGISMSYRRFLEFATAQDVVKFGIIKGEPLMAQLRDLTQRLRGGKGVGASFSDAVASLTLAEVALL